MRKQYRNKITAAIHETATGLYAAGGIDRQTMREFDGRCLTPIQTLTAEDTPVGPQNQRTAPEGAVKAKRPRTEANRIAEAKYREKRSPYTDAGKSGVVVFQHDGTPVSASELANRPGLWVIYSGTRNVEFTKTSSTAKAFHEFALVEMARKVIWKIP